MTKYALMRIGSAQFRASSWLAILALTLQALWPLLASARASQPLMEVCTAQGLIAFPGDPGSQQDGDRARHLKPHCPLCSFGTDKLAAPPSTLLCIVATDRSAAIPPADASREGPHGDIRSPAFARAPPALS